MDWQDAEWQDFWTEWRRWLAWESEWRTVVRQQAERLGLLPLNPAQLVQSSGLTEPAGLEAADWRLLLGGGRAEAFGRQNNPEGIREARRSVLSRQSSKRRAGLTGPAAFDKAAAYLAAEPLAAYLAAGREVGGSAEQTLARPLEKSKEIKKIRNWRPEPKSRAGKRAAERLEEAGAVGEMLTLGQEPAAEQEPAAVGQKPLRVNLRSRLADEVDNPEIAEIAWPEMPKKPDLAEVQSAGAAEMPEIAEAYKTAEIAAGDNQLPEWPEAELAGEAGAFSFSVTESENEAQNLAHRPEKRNEAAEAGRADMFAPPGDVDVGAVAEAVAEILCAEIEAQLGSASFLGTI